MGFFGYYPWVPESIGYPKFENSRVIPELYHDKQCSYNQKSQQKTLGILVRELKSKIFTSSEIVKWSFIELKKKAY